MTSFVHSIDGRFWRYDLFTSFVVTKGRDGNIIIRASLPNDETTVDFRSEDWFERPPDEQLGFLPALPGHYAIQTELTRDGTFEHRTFPLIGWRVDRELVVRPLIAHQLSLIPDEDDDLAVLYPNGTVSDGRDGVARIWPSLVQYLAEREAELRADAAVTVAA